MTVIGKIVWFLLLVCTDVLEVSEGRLAPEKVDLGPTKPLAFCLTLFTAQFSS